MMKRVVAVIACGLSLSACESMNMSMPSMDIFKSTPATTEVRVDSEPAGAEARSPAGVACRTPCTLALPASGTTVVSFSLQGYQPTSIPVTIGPSESSGGYSDGANTLRIDPNPAFATLEIAAPPPPPPRKKPAKKRAAKPRPPAAAPAAQAPAEQQPAAQAPPQQQPGGFGPPNSAPPQSVFR
jgi:hypothetical protein